jgi:hypothetical protein
VCVWVRQIRQLRLTIPSPRALPCASGAFLGGSQGGSGMPPPGYVQRLAPGDNPGPMGFGETSRGYVQCLALGGSPGLRGSGQRPKFFFLGGFCYF